LKEGPVPLPRRSSGKPRTGDGVAIPALNRFVVAGAGAGGAGGKSPRRLQQDDRLNFEETKIVELFKKLSMASQNKVLDAMEDWQDDVAEQDIIRNADEEEKRIKAAKLEALRVEDEKREARLSRLSMDVQQQREVVQPAVVRNLFYLSIFCCESCFIRRSIFVSNRLMRKL
jgi:hypothetical protein